MLEDGALRFLSNWDRISALLGLLVDFLDCLEDVPSEDRDHLSFEPLWICWRAHVSTSATNESQLLRAIKKLYVVDALIILV